jgi:CTD small phosphatase-like protein 2
VGWTGIFSPVLKYFGNEAPAPAGGPSATHGGSASIPVLAPAPAAGRSVAATAAAGGTSSGDALASRFQGAVSLSSSSAVAAAASRFQGAPSSSAASTAGRLAVLSPGGAAAAAPAAGRSAGYGAPAAAAPPQPKPLSPEEIAQARQNAAMAAAAQAAAEDAAEKAMVLRNAPPKDVSTEEEQYEEFNPYLFIKMLPAYARVAPVPVPIRMPRKSKFAPPINLVLDLDETLVHCSVEPIDDADVRFPVMFNGVDYNVYVRKRPHLDRFLQWIAGRFEVTIFTASQQVYAEKLLSLLDPENKYINHRLYRDSCLNVDGNYLKDLNVLGRDLTKTVLVDNSPHAFGYQLDNGIPIESWFDERKDTELLKLIRFLDTLQGVTDVRPVVRERFKTWQLVRDAVIPPDIY